jgi:hypothetical protein
MLLIERPLYIRAGEPGYVDPDALGDRVARKLAARKAREKAEAAAKAALS